MELSMTASEMAYNEISRMMLSGELSPGQRVSQSGLARRFGCSTVPVVEAMRRLESEGFLVKEGRRMARVRKLLPGDMEGLYLIREGLESVAARLCARRISEANLVHLKALGNRLDAAIDINDGDAFNGLEIEVHRCIVENSGCPLLAEELSRLLLIERTAGARKSIGTLSRRRHSHRAILEAISDHDEDLAEYLMKKHIQKGYAELENETEINTDAR
jgi:DNA-binding GntR family transcriptional regulator